MDRVDGWLDALERGQSGKILAVGRPGIGKSRFLDQVERRALTRNIAVRRWVEERTLSTVSFEPAVVLHDLGPAYVSGIDRLIDLSERITAFPSLFIGTLDDDLRDLDLLREHGFELVRLGPLDRDAVRTIVAETFDAAPTRTDDDIERIVDLASGHPQYAIELAREPLRGVPPSIALRLAALERQLGSAPLQVLAVCAACVDVSGTIDVTLVRRLLPAGNVTSILETARPSRLIDSANRFAHPLIATALLARLSDARRRRYHRRAAVILSERPPSNEAFLAIAGHLERAGDGRRAAENICIVANDLVVRGRPEKAYALYRRALETYGEPTRWLAFTHRQAACIARSLEKPQAAIEHLEAALAIHTVEGGRDERAAVLIELARLHGIARDLESAERCALRTLALYKDAYSFTPQKYAVAAILANIAHVRGDVALMRKLVAQIDDVIERLPDDIRWDALRMRATLKLRECGSDRAPAIVDLREASRLTNEAGMLYETSMVESLLGQALFADGDTNGARDAFGRAFEIAVRTGDRRRTHVALFHLAELASMADDRIAMTAITHKLEATIADADLPWLALSAARLGLSIGAATTEACRRDFERRVDVQTRHLAGLAFARLAARDGDVGAVTATLETLARDIDRVAFNPTVDFVLLSARYGNEALVRRARNLIERVEMARGAQCAVAVRALFEAWTARRQRDMRRAREEARRAKREFSRVGWRVFANEAATLASFEPKAAFATTAGRNVRRPTA